MAQLGHGKIEAMAAIQQAIDSDLLWRGHWKLASVQLSRAGEAQAKSMWRVEAGR